MSTDRDPRDPYAADLSDQSCYGPEEQPSEEIQAEVEAVGAWLGVMIDDPSPATCDRVGWAFYHLIQACLEEHRR